MERGARAAKAKAEGRPSGTRKSGKRNDSSASRISVNVLGDANGNSLFAGVSDASVTSKDPTGIPEPGTLALVLATPSTAGARTRMDPILFSAMHASRRESLCVTACPHSPGTSATASVNRTKQPHSFA